MNKDKKTIYIVSFATFAILLAAFFINTANSKIVAAVLLVPLTLFTCLLIKKRGAHSINKKGVLVLSAVVGVLYVILLQVLGAADGIYRNPYFVNATRLLDTVIPLVVIIVSSEIMRSVILLQKNKIANVTVFLSCVLIEVISFSSLSGIHSFNTFMDLVGLTLFPAIMSNVYYHYVSKNYGAVPNIAFRLITTLYIYFLPMTTGINDALHACIKMFIPIIMLVLVSALFGKKKKYAVKKSGKLSNVAMVISFVIIIAVSMLISCQFRFGAIVIATGSMTGEINMGDMIIYEEYTNQKIEEGQVIVFRENGNRIVHRVVDIETVGGQKRYYTKGDANNGVDAGYRVDADIVGLTDIKIAYVGYPTLLLREALGAIN